MAKFTVEFDEYNDFNELTMIVNRKTVLGLINSYLSEEITEDEFKKTIEKYI